MATATKQKPLTQVLALLGKAPKPSEPMARPVLEQFIYALLRENATCEAADQAFHNLQARFFDWNEVRVSAVREIGEALDGIVSNPDQRAQRIVDFLQEVFDTTYSFDLDALQKKGLKQAAKQLSRFQAANDFGVAWVLQNSLEGHALPVDSASLRVIRRLGLVEDTNDLEALRTSLEHQVPKAKGAQFVALLSEIASENCWEDAPDCSRCPLRLSCNSSQTSAPAAKKPR